MPNMIPSSPRRTWTFLLLSSAAFFGPDLFVAASVSKSAEYIFYYNLYQGILVLLGFWLAPMICRRLVEHEVLGGPLRQAVDEIRDQFRNGARETPCPDLPLTVIDHRQPFILTVGLLPDQITVFATTGLLKQLGHAGLRFVIARSLAHGQGSQRLAAVVPALVLALSFNELPASIAAWVEMALVLLILLIAHWIFELKADRQAARIMGEEAISGLRQLLATQDRAQHLFSLSPPIKWRLGAVASSV